MTPLHSDLRAIARFSFGPLPRRSLLRSPALLRQASRSSSTTDTPSVCTADELHYVRVPNSDWKLALWRYLPPADAPKRNHPLLLLSGVGTNAIGYDLSPDSSFARHMCAQGFDTWTMEVRGAGLSTRVVDFKDISTTPTSNLLSENLASHKNYDGQQGVIASQTQSFSGQDSSETLTKRDLIPVSEDNNSGIVSQLRDLSRRLLDIIEESQKMVPLPFTTLRERFVSTIEEFHDRLDVIDSYDWDLDDYLEDDLPAVINYVRGHSRPRDGKLHAVGHSMGGILLYAILSKCGFEREDSGFASIATLGSSLDYTSSRSSLKWLLPLANPAQAFKVPVIPLGGLMAVTFPLAARPPYFMSWLNSQISAHDMMEPELLEKLVLNNFCTVPSKLLLQLTTAFYDGGLRDRSGSFLYKDHIAKSNVPILAIAGDQDLVCPPEAVYETAKLIPPHLLKYKVFGEPGGPHYAHYDIVGGRMAAVQVYPCIVDFFNQHDYV
ncbi:hypothetical protein MLD38_038294 [Melastoma candidum]|uniref:Uncharacterized protein n=1 Tax=Melastoma candidum TaxID=119954 RepID=A0ACB9KZ45_9MYRT|nr:hypothetical protein MLD38_038294 [Melastoma candidum]